MLACCRLANKDPLNTFSTLGLGPSVSTIPYVTEGSAKKRSSRERTDLLCIRLPWRDSKMLSVRGENCCIDSLCPTTTGSRSSGLLKIGATSYCLIQLHPAVTSRAATPVIGGGSFGSSYLNGSTTPPQAFLAPLQQLSGPPPLLQGAGPSIQSPEKYKGTLSSAAVFLCSAYQQLSPSPAVSQLYHYFLL